MIWPNPPLYNTDKREHTPPNSYRENIDSQFSVPLQKAVWRLTNQESQFLLIRYSPGRPQYNNKPSYEILFDFNFFDFQIKQKGVQKKKKKRAVDPTTTNTLPTGQQTQPVLQT